MNSNAYRMPRWRMLLVYLGITALVLGHTVSFIRDRDHWPFSSYPMYSEVELDTSMRRMWVYGVGEDGTEVDLMSRRDYIAPFDMTRLHFAMRWLESRDPALVEAALADVLDRYEQRRAANAHNGPVIDAVRLYELEWQIDPQVSNRDNPERRELRFELVASEAAENEVMR